MLKINYYEQDSDTLKTKEYKTPDEFVANQQLEVPDFEDYLKIDSATVDGNKISLDDSTMRGLYNYLSK